NDWPDAEATAILSRCAEAARPDGRVVVLGGGTPDEARSGLVIEMALLGGKYRTVTEVQDLAREAGLEAVSAGRQPSGHLVTECHPLSRYKERYLCSQAVPYCPSLSFPC